MSNKNKKKVSTASISKPNPAEKEFKTDDVGLAAALRYLYHPLIRIERGAKPKFVFPYTDKIEEEARQHEIHNLWVISASYIDAFEEMLAELYSDNCPSTDGPAI